MERTKKFEEMLHSKNTSEVENYASLLCMPKDYFLYGLEELGLKADRNKEIVENECNFKSVEFTDLKNMLSKTSRGKHNGGTWMNPTLFTKFAMYLSPKFEYHAIRFISDQMINYRKSAGDEYISLGRAIQKIVGNSFIQVAMKKVSDAMNWVVFNQSARGERNNHGEESSQFELAELERTISMLINEGFIRSYDQLINYLRKKWQEKYQPKVLQS